MESACSVVWVEDMSPKQYVASCHWQGKKKQQRAFPLLKTEFKLSAWSVLRSEVQYLVRSLDSGSVQRRGPGVKTLLDNNGYKLGSQFYFYSGLFGS